MKNLRNAWGSYLKYGNKLVLEENSVVYRQGGEGKGFFSYMKVG